MDDKTFTNELHNINRKVAAMAERNEYLASLWTPTNQPDVTVSDDATFTSQLHDLKAQLADMQKSLKLRHSQQTCNFLDTQSSAPELAQVLQNHNGVSATNTNFALPSGPLFWQLFNTLRTDVHTLESRVSTVEHTVSDLEDKLDGIAPQFTPTSSVGTAEADFPTFPEVVFCPDIQSTPIPASKRMSQQSQYTTAEQPCLLSDDNALGSSLEQSNPRGLNAMNFGALAASYSKPEGTAFRDKEIAQLDDMLTAAAAQLRAAEQRLTEKDEQISQLEFQNSALSTRLGKLATNLVEKYRELSDNRSHISRMETGMKQLRQDILTRDNAIESWRSRCHNVEDCLDQTRADLEHSDARVHAWRKYAEDCNERRHDEVGAREDMIQRLQEFCEHKDVIATEQDNIISRGANLLYERDDEIERLGRRLEKAESSNEFRRHEKSDLLKALQKREEEVTNMRRHLQKICEKDKEEWNKLPYRFKYTAQVSDELCKHPALKMMFRAGDAVDDERKDERAATDEHRVATDDTYPAETLLPSQYIQSDDRKGDSHKRSSSRICPKRAYEYVNQPGQTVRTTANGDPRLPDTASNVESCTQNGQQGLLHWENSDAGEWMNTEDSHAERRTHRSRQEDSTSQPPLPSHAAATRVQSMADLRSTSPGSKKARGMSKFKSMGDLGRRALQPYVENENEVEVELDESGDKLGGSV